MTLSMFVGVHKPLFWGDRLGAAALRGALLTSVPLVSHERFVDGEMFHVGFEDVDDVRLTGDHHQLKRGERVK